MEGEVGQGVRIILALVVLLFVIGIVTVIVAVARNSANENTNGLTNQMDQMSAAKFTDYDQQVMSGIRVKSAINQFAGNAIGIVVITKKSQDGTMEAPYDGYNYGALLKTGSSSDGTGGTAVTAAKPEIRVTGKATGASWYTVDYGTEPVHYNLDTKPLDATGSDTSVRNSAHFLAELIKSTSGDTIGIIFIQQN